ncbi:beta strand repeat-containing protein, partial [Pseudomonas huaxiensis]|uniref:beta strand repeat-containing protein n=1 Tax=Pseudomonas huaxiensis TaxID=2213017 RepID=UPI001CDD2EC7
GKGGFIETSGAHVNVADSAKVTTKAASGKTGTWLIDPNDFTIAASGGNMTGASVSAAVQSNNFEIQTATMGTAAGNGDIHVNDAITWNSGNTLTLNAERNINVNAAITAEHASGKVALRYGQGSADGGTADYVIKAPVNLQSGDNFSTQKGTTGAKITYTVVNNAADLQNMNKRLSGNYAVGSDIDLSSIANWLPVGDIFANNEFTGRLAGLGHALANLTINRTDIMLVGLFGRTGSESEIRDIGLVGGSVVGAVAVGGLAGRNAGRISNVYTTVSVSGSTGVGGLVSENTGSISNAYATGSVTSSGISAGGLVGANFGSISNAYATGSVSGSDYVGGLAGQNGGSISNAYATGSVVGQGTYVGGMVGFNRGSISNAYWDLSSTGQSYGASSGATAITDSDRYSPGSYAALGNWALVNGTRDVYAASDANGVTQWIMIEGQTRPFLASEYSISIRNAHQLQLMAYNLGAHYTLAMNIDASATAGRNASGMWSTAGFVSVGDASNHFVGTFDGQNHTIDELTIDRAFTDGIGLFGRTGSGSEIRNTGLVGGSVAGRSDVGMLVGRSDGSISNAFATGRVSGDLYVGGLVGRSDGSISNAYATGSVRGSDNVGGLAGKNGGSIGNAYATGSVMGGGTVGGLVGWNIGSIASSFYAITDAGGNSINNGGRSTGAFTGNSNGAAKTTDELLQASTFAGWSMASTGGTDAIWRIYEGYTGPLLRSLLKPLTVTVADVTGKTYDGTNGQVAGVRHSLSDNRASLLGSASYTSAATRNAGTYGLGVTGLYSAQQGYDVSVVEGSYRIDKASLAVGGVSATNKTYDGTHSAILTGTAALTGTVFGQDVVAISNTGSATFADKNVGTGKAVTVTYTLSGSDADNYSLIQPSGLTAEITRADLTVAGVSANNKIYDGTQAATLSGTATINAIGQDVVFVSDTGSASFGDKNAGTGKAVIVNGYTLSGGDAGNYNLVQPTGLTAEITRAGLMVSGVSAANKTYDGTRAATLSGTATINAIGQDEVSVSGTGAASFADKNAGTGKAVTVNGYTLSGADANNYTLDQPTGLTANINKADLAITGISASNKTYDGTDSALLTGTAALSGTVFGQDAVIISDTGGAAFADKNAGTGKAVTVTYTLSGSDAGNYSLVQPIGLTADISKADLVVTGIGASNKTYDATNAATLTGTAAVSAIGQDRVSLSGAGVGSFADKNAGADKAVTVTGFALSGSDANNYSLVQPTGLTADIGKASIHSITGITAVNRTYDGSIEATLNYDGAGFTGRLANDELNVVSATGAFANKNAANNKAVAITGITLGGTDAANYTLVNDTSATTADIAKAALTITADNVSKVAGQSIALKGYTTRGLVGGDSVVSVSLSSSGELSSAAAGVYAIVVSDAIGSALDNYAIHYERGTLLVHSDQPYLGAMTSNGQTVSTEAKQQGHVPEALDQN